MDGHISHPRRQTLTIAEIVSELGGSRAFWSRQLTSRRLQHIRLGRRILVTRDALTRWIELHTVAEHSTRGRRP